MSIRAVITDIEGTTSSLDFVKRTLFPYAAAQLPAYLAAHRSESDVRMWIEQIAVEGQVESADLAAVNGVLQRWIKEDRKNTQLKAIQGRIWEAGYSGGAFKAHVYPDALRQLTAWFGAGVELYLYSSGSIEAQNLFFGHTTYGDLRPLFRRSFDTTIGGKRDPVSYQRILREINRNPSETMFLSDIVEELDAAKTSHIDTVHVIRDLSLALQSTHRCVRSFDDIAL